MKYITAQIEENWKPRTKMGVNKVDQADSDWKILGAKEKNIKVPRKFNRPKWKEKKYKSPI